MSLRFFSRKRAGALVLGFMAAIATAAASPCAHAQDGEGGMSTVDSSSFPSLGTPGQGIRLGESTLMHARVSAEAGVDTNVFYNDIDQKQAPALIVSPSIWITNATRQGAAPHSFSYVLGASVTYREYLTDDAAIKQQSSLNPSLALGLGYSPARQFGISFTDTFSRTEEAPYVAGTEKIVRGYNQAALQLAIEPGGGRLKMAVRYTNSLDLYESSSYKGAANMAHGLMLDSSWHWFPKTALYLQGNGSRTSYLSSATEQGNNRRLGSYGVSATGGIRGLITPKLNMDLGAGYGTSFYDGDTSTPSAGESIVGTATFGYRLNAASGLSLGYTRGQRNSAVIGSFSDYDAIRLGVGSMLFQRLGLQLQGGYENRRTHDVTIPGIANRITRTDNILSGEASLDFYIQQWFYAGAGYRISRNSSDIDEQLAAMNSNVVFGAEYTKQFIYGRIGITY